MKIDSEALPDIDGALYMQSEEDIAAFLADLLADNDTATTSVALDTARCARLLHGLPVVDQEIDRARKIAKE